MIEDYYQQAQRLINQKAYQQAHQCLLTILSKDRQHAGAFYLLAIIASDHRNYIKAIELATKAIQLSEQIEYAVFIAKQYLLMHDHVQAKNYADKATNNANLSAQLCDDLGVIYSQMGLHQNAISYFVKAEQLTASDRINPQLYLNLGASYNFCGQFNQAVECYRQAIKQDKHCVKAYLAITTLDRLTTEEVAYLEHALTNEREVNQQLYIAHALARHSEKHKNFSQAFALLKQVKQRKKVEIGYQFATDAAIFSSLEQFFQATPVSTALSTATSQDSQQPIFIVGMPRTGTTVVERLISQAPNILSAGEMQHFAVQLKQQTKVQSSALLDVETINACQGLDWQELGRGYLARTQALTHGAERFIDKMPINFLYVGFILTALPNAKIICLDRDPLDTIVSNYRQLFATDFSFYRYSYDLDDCAQYYQAFNRLMMFWQQRFPDNFYRLNYQAFVNDPAQYGQALYQFIDEPWQKSYLNLSTNTSPVATASAAQVRSGISNQSVGAWRNYQQALSGIIEKYDVGG
ncbi:tetratricopeptide repeat-containing sulfotransferase family protein [Colwellia sp. MEBiC06753]